MNNNKEKHNSNVWKSQIHDPDLRFLRETVNSASSDATSDRESDTQLVWNPKSMPVHNTNVVGGTNVYTTS
jgi:hypothetical protein